MSIVKELLVAGADIFQRNTNNEMARKCAKGNYILTKFLKMGEQMEIKKQMETYKVNN